MGNAGTFRRATKRTARPAEHVRRGLGWAGNGLVCVGMVCAGCTCSPTTPNRLDAMGKVTVKAKGHEFEAWIADDPDERERGLMFVTADQMKPAAAGRERGMLFVFPQEQRADAGFWMRNTGIQLDIAFIRSDGEIVRTHTMTPYDEHNYLPGAPYRYALEVNGGLFSRMEIRKGDRVEIPAAVLQNVR